MKYISVIFLISSVFCLNAKLSFNQCATIPSSSIVALMKSAAFSPKCYPHLEHLLAYGSNGLRDGWDEGCADWNTEVFTLVRNYVGHDIDRQELFMSRKCLLNLNDQFVSTDSINTKGLAFLIDDPDPADLYSSFFETLIEASKYDVFNRWWRNFPPVDWKVIAHKGEFVNTPIYLAAFNEIVNISELSRPLKVSILTLISNFGIIEERLAEALFYIIRLLPPGTCSTMRMGILHDPIFKIFFQLKNSLPSINFEISKWIVYYTMGVNTDVSVEIDQTIPVASLLSLLLIKDYVTFNFDEMSKFLRSVACSLSDPVRSNDQIFFFFDHYMNLGCEANYLQILLSNAQLRHRLMAIGPPRDPMKAPLLFSDYSIQYFRRWMVKSCTLDLHPNQSDERLAHQIVNLHYSVALPTVLPNSLSTEGFLLLLLEQNSVFMKEVYTIMEMEQWASIIVRLRLHYDSSLNLDLFAQRILRGCCGGNKQIMEAISIVFPFLREEPFLIDLFKIKSTF